jgi:hypothetical protein
MICQSIQGIGRGSFGGLGGDAPLDFAFHPPAEKIPAQEPRVFELLGELSLDLRRDLLPQSLPRSLAPIYKKVVARHE